MVCALTIEYALLIFLLSSIPSVSTLEDVPIAEYMATPESAVEHAFEYLVLGFLVYLSLVRAHQFVGNGPRYILSVVLCVIYGIIDEIHQNFVPGRVMSANDVIFDTIGALIGVTVAYFVWKTGKKRMNIK
jgi:VanZ family protein